MIDRVASWIEVALAAYVVVGLCFAFGFAFRFANQLDPSARSGSLGFRLLLLPGSVALWPVLALRLSGRPPAARNAHEGGNPGMAILRRRHLLTFVVLLCAMPFAIPLSLAAQRSARTNSSLPPDPLGARAADLGSVSEIVAAQDVPALGGGRFVCARVRGGVLLRQDAPELPDVLAYWTAADASVTALPADARLLGKLDGAPRRFPHPGGSGQVIFYSLAHGAVVASWRVSGN